MADDAFSRSGIRALLKLWHDSSRLGAHPLAQTAAVARLRANARHADSEAGRGVALRDLLRSCIDSLKPGDTATPDYGDKRWRPYLILTEQYANGRKPEYLAERLGLVRGSFHQEQARALELLGSRLRERLDTDTQAVAAATPVANEPARPPFLAPVPPGYALIGRDLLLDDLKATLYGAVAAVAIHGLPGAGKTTLAVALANDRDVLEAFGDGVLWAGVGTQPDLLGLLGHWAAALGLSREDIARLNSIDARAAAIHSVIGLRRMLLVVDDVWRIEEADALRLGGPNCAHIFTTRQPALALAIAPDNTFGAPVLDDANGTALLASHAPGVDAEHHDAVAALVRAVDGLPLALALMGRRLRAATLGNQSRRMRQTIDTLLSEFGSHDGKALAGVIASSEAMLDTAGRAALAALAQFPPKPASFDEGAAVAAADCDIEVIDALVDAGLIESDGQRLTLHQTIADYARARDDDRLNTLRRMLEYFGGATDGGDGRDLSNALHAIERAQALGLQREAALCVVAIAPALELRGMLGQAERALDAALNADIDALVRAALERQRGTIARRRGDFALASAHYDRAAEALAVAPESPERAAQARVELALARCTLANDRGERERASEIGLAALPQAEAWGDARLLSALLTQLAAAAGFRAQFDESKSFLERARHMAQASRDVSAEALTSLGLGLIASWLGEVADGDAQFEHSHALAVSVDARETASIARSMQGWVNANLGRYERAAEQSREALGLIREGSFCESAGLAYTNLGLITMSQGDYEEADRLVAKGMAVVRQIGHKEGECMMLNSRARLAAERGDYAAAEQIAREGIRQCDALDYLELMPSLMATLGEALNAKGNYEDADGFLLTSLTMAHAMNRPWLTAYANLVWGGCLLDREEIDRAHEAYEDALRESGLLQAQPFVALALFGLARIAAMRNDAEGARELGQRSLEAFDAIGHARAARVRAWLAAIPRYNLLPAPTRNDNNEAGITE